MRRLAVIAVAIFIALCSVGAASADSADKSAFPGLVVILADDGAVLHAEPWRAAKQVGVAGEGARFIAERWQVVNDMPEEGKESGASDAWYKVLFDAGEIVNGPARYIMASDAREAGELSVEQEERVAATRYGRGFADVDISTLRHYGDWRDIFCTGPYLLGANASEAIRRFGPGEVRNEIGGAWDNVQIYDNAGIKAYFCDLGSGTLEMLDISREGFDLLGIVIGRSGPERVKELLGEPDDTNESWREDGEPTIWIWGDESGFVQVYFNDAGDRVAKVQTGVEP